MLLYLKNDLSYQIEWMSLHILGREEESGLQEFHGIDSWVQPRLNLGFTLGSKTKLTWVNPMSR